MLSKTQLKLIRALQTKKGRETHGLCLVEGRKNVAAAGKAIRFRFSAKDTKSFKKLVSTETPQDIAAVAEIPRSTLHDITSGSMIIVLDGVQDPGNVGAIMRLCLAFDASLLLIESADPTSPKVVRASAGALFAVPWQALPRSHAEEALFYFNRPIYRLEKTKGSVTEISEKKAILIAGSEGSGIKLPIKGKSLTITHSKKLESLNVGHAIAIALSQTYKQP